MQGIFSDLPQVLIEGITLGSLYAIVALGYTMVYGILELINFAHGEIFMVGAFASTALLVPILKISWVAALPAIVLVLFAMVFSAGFTGLLGIGMERLAYRPLRNQHAPKLIALLTAVGVSFLLQDIVRFIAELSSGSFTLTGKTIIDGTLHIPLSHWFSFLKDVTMKSNSLLVIGISVAIMLGLDMFVNRTRWGIAMRAVAQDQPTASLMGINVTSVIVITFLIGSSIGGIAGFLYAQQLPTVTPFIGLALGLKAFTAAVLGGIGNLRGAMLGGLLIGVMETLASSYLNNLTGGAMGSAYKDVLTFVVLIAVLIFRPGGLLGQVVREKV